MTNRWLTLATASILWMAMAGTASANTEFLNDNCDRKYNVCASKCVPEIKLVVGDDGRYVYKADARKVPSCRIKCVASQNKCRTEAESAAPVPVRACTTSAQCRTGEGCFDGRCLVL